MKYKRKSKTKENLPQSGINPISDRHAYYFHADEDFREDYTWSTGGAVEFSKQRNPMDKRKAD